MYYLTQYTQNITYLTCNQYKMISEFFIGKRSSKSGVYFTLAEQLNLDRPHSACSVDT